MSNLRRTESGERVTAYVPANIAKELRVKCANERRSVSDFVSLAVADLLNAQQDSELQSMSPEASHALQAGLESARTKPQVTNPTYSAPISKRERRLKRRITIEIDVDLADAIKSLSDKTNRPVTYVVEVSLRKLLGI